MRPWSSVNGRNYTGSSRQLAACSSHRGAAQKHAVLPAPSFPRCRDPQRRLVARLAAAASPEAKQGFPEPTKERQVLRFREPQSDVEVVLVGTMHYNPTSISLAANTVKDLVDKGRLGALVLETCPKRWAKTQVMQPPGTPLRMVLDNEFQAAQEASMGTAPLILGDQGVEELGVAAKSLASSTLKDLLSPLEGWGRITRDYQRCWARDLSGVAGAALNPGDLLLDPLLILAAPVSFIRYPLAWAIKAPRTFIPLFSVVLGIDYFLGHLPASGSSEETAFTALFSVLDVLEVVFLSRLFLVALLERRNDILARSVRDACAEAADGTAVVAILGAAHLNGIQQRLIEEEPLEGVVGGVKAPDVAT